MLLSKSLLVIAAVLSLAALAPASSELTDSTLVLNPGEWQLDVEFIGTPQPIMVKLAGEEQPRRFWYLLYTITNNSGTDVDFYPRIEVFTNTFKLYTTGTQNRREVFEAIRTRYADRIPLMEPRDFVTGKLLQGQDNARDSVIIFEDFDPEATSFKVLFAGLSNQSREITVGSGEKEKKFLLHRTLMLEYRVPGDRFNPDQKVTLYRDREWILR